MTLEARDILKRMASKLPLVAQQGLKRSHFRRQIRRKRFRTDEPEFSRLPDWLVLGDWVMDVGANVGHYTLRMSDLVGSSGRVLAFEPVPTTFELLSANVSAANAPNVSLFNVAASSENKLTGMSLPTFASGLTNYYMAQLTSGSGSLQVLALPLDSFMPPKPISLVKLDVEGHELPALQGMHAILRRDRPRLIVEGRSIEVETFLSKLGYRFEDDPHSPNRVFFVDPPGVRPG